MTRNALYEKICALVKNNETFTLITVITSDGSSPASAGMKMVVCENGENFGTIGGGELELLAIAYARENTAAKVELVEYSLDANSSSLTKNATRTSMLCGGIATLLFERFYSHDKLYIIGAGHCAIALEKIAKFLDYYVIVIDDRSEWACQAKHSLADQIHCIDYNEIDKTIDFDSRTFIAVMTHGHQYDLHVVQKCLRKEFAYLGMIGSTQKLATTFAKLRELGFSDAEISRIKAPIGLPINSHTPEEIAISIAAQLIEIRNCR